MLKDKFVLVGVTGSIAAYKAVSLVRLLKKQGANVQVIMTKSAQEFVKPLTFQVVSQNPVITDMFATPSRWDVEHVSLADRADVFLVAPATANIIGKMSSGIADDMLTSTLLATKAKIVIVPAMNVNMYENSITRYNMDFLRQSGIYVMEPEEGYLACGYTGRGRFPDPEDIVKRVEVLLGQDGDLKGKKILITAGPTREPIDPVRFITNHSSGKMGYALAKRAVIRGGKVVLVSGPTNIAAPDGLHKFIPIETAKEMYDAVMDHFDWADMVIKSAAVADYSPKFYASNKIKKREGSMAIDLKRNPDILKSLGARKTHQILVGFAAETCDAEKNALNKLREKNLDFIVLNDVTAEGAGFTSDTNVVKILYKEGKTEELPKMLKSSLADKILDRILTYVPQSRAD